MKTVYQLIEEYKNRQTPQYAEMDIVKIDGSMLTYRNISNLREERDSAIWLVFNSKFAGEEEEEVRIKGGMSIIYRTAQKINE